jgi:hypothetical protein
MGCLDPGTAVMLWLPLPAIEEVELGGDEDEDEEGTMGVRRWRFPKVDGILDRDVSTEVTRQIQAECARQSQY